MTISTTVSPPPKVPKRRKFLLLTGIGLSTFAIGFALTWFRLLPPLPWENSGVEGVVSAPLPDIAFVAIEPITVSLGPNAKARHLRLSAQLETEASAAAEVTLLLPRIRDVLNSYLRAVELRQIEDPATFVVLRAQMLRRIQIVTGQGRVRDLLISEFVLG